jgi:holo-[acyl-carrier protein] synthase
MIRIFQGIDLVSVARIQEVITRHSAFLDEIYTPRERDYCLARLAPHRYLAGRFAVKEACLKALGHGLISNGIDRVLSEIEVVSSPSGPPQLVLHGWAAALSRKKHILQRTVSISHSGDYAVAIVILVGRGPFGFSDEGF